MLCLEIYQCAGTLSAASMEANRQAKFYGKTSQPVNTPVMPLAKYRYCPNCWRGRDGDFDCGLWGDAAEAASCATRNRLRMELPIATVESGTCSTWERPTSHPPPDLVPSFPYLTMKAKAAGPAGPWIKQKDVVPFRTKEGTHYSITASPGQAIKHGDEYLQFFSATTRKPGNSSVQRTLGIARTTNLDGPWIVDPQPVAPIEEQIENSSLHYEESIKTWFLFTNHIGIDSGEYTDAVWVY